LHRNHNWRPLEWSWRAVGYVDLGISVIANSFGEDKLVRLSEYFLQYLRLIDFLCQCSRGSALSIEVMDYIVTGWNKRLVGAAFFQEASN